MLCPGLTATEFHLSRGEAPVPGREQAVHEEGGMPVGEVIDASLRDLEKGTVVCVPGVEGASPVVTLEAAELAIRSASRGTLA